MVRLVVYFVVAFFAFCLFLLAIVPTLLDAQDLGSAVGLPARHEREAAVPPGVVSGASQKPSGRAVSEPRLQRGLGKLGQAMSLARRGEPIYYAGGGPNHPELEPTEDELDQVKTVNRWMRRNVETPTVQRCLSQVPGTGSLALKFKFVRAGDRFVPHTDDGVQLEESTLPEESDPAVLDCIRPQLVGLRMRVHQFARSYQTHTIYRDYEFPVPTPQ